MKLAESWSLIAFEVAAVRQSGERPAAAAAGYAAIYIVLCLSLAAWAFSKREF